MTKSLTKPLHFHLSGIGGAAMAPLAGMLAESGHRVTGSDTGVYPPASTLLEGLGIRWTNGFSESSLDPRPTSWFSAMRCRAAIRKWKPFWTGIFRIARCLRLLRNFFCPVTIR